MLICTGVSHDILPTADRPVFDTPILSQITCLGGPSDDTGDINLARNNLQRKDETSFVKLCRDGGHKGTIKLNVL
jgi:hypothetical protein